MPGFVLSGLPGMNGVVNGTIRDMVSDPGAVFVGITDVNNIAYMKICKSSGMIAADGNGGVFWNGESFGLSRVLPRNVNAANFGLGRKSKSKGENDGRQTGFATEKSCFHHTNMFNTLLDVRGARWVTVIQTWAASRAAMASL